MCFNFTDLPVVLLKGDNYVGSAEPQLREKMASLFSEVAGYPGRPTNAQLANLKVIEDQFTAAKAKLKRSKPSSLP